MNAVRVVVGALLLCALAFSATFGTVVPLVGGASDLVLDEARGRLYLVNSSQNRIEVYSIPQRRFLSTIRTEALPLSAAMSRDGKYLYVASFDGTALNVVDLDSSTVTSRVSLPAKPEGVAVGADGRVLISTIGTGANNLGNVLLLFDPNATDTSSLSVVQITPPPPSNPILPAPNGRIFLSNRSQLLASKDGTKIIGVNIPNNNSRSVFVFEVASGTILRTRSVTNVSSVLAVSPDGSRFMTGLTLFDTDTLEVLAQQNVANSPFPYATGVNFNLQQNQGGSVFAPDGKSLYSAFNTAPVQVPAARANVSELLVNDPDNLLIRLGFQLPENLSGKIVISSDGANAYAISESGFLTLPMSQIAQNPIATPESNVALLTTDQCSSNPTAAKATVAVKNEGRGRMTVTAQVLQTTPTGPAGLGGVGGAGGGVVGGGVVIVIPPVGVPGGGVIPPGVTLPGGNTGQNAGIATAAPSVRTTNTSDGANLDLSFTASSSARVPGTVSPTHTFLLQSNEAINIPPAVRVFQNFRNAESRGDIIPVPVGLSANEALEDMVIDNSRSRIYIANSGLNRVEVFDMRRKQLLTPIKVGQLPRSLALTPDGNTLYVANTGGESISIIDAEKMQVTGRVKFPPLPFNSAAAIMSPSVISAGLRGLQIIMNNGTIWRVVGDEAVPRPISPIIGTATITAPRTMAATPNGEYIMLLSGNGFVYLYDSLADEYVQGRQVFTNPIQGFYGPVAAGPRGQFYLANGTVLNQSLTPIASADGVTVPGGRPGTTPTTTPRPISAVAVASGNSFLRFAQPIRTNAAALASDTPVLELVDSTSGAVTRQSPALEGPLSTVVGTGRANVNGRTLAVDAAGTTAYAITTSGLSIVPLDVQNPVDRPVISQGGIVSNASYTPAVAPNSVISIFGRNLGNLENASTSPLPTILGGVCVTMNNTPLPLFLSSTGQINAVVPPETAAGRFPVVVRSIDKKLASLPASMAVTKVAPAVFVNPQTKEAAVYRANGKPVNHENAASRDERLVLYATGLGATTGGRVVSGAPSPSNPPAETSNDVQVFFGDPRYKEAEMIVEWSGLVPGFVGLYQINIYVRGDRIRGDNLPVTVRVAGTDSQTTGPAVPVVAVQ